MPPPTRYPSQSITTGSRYEFQVALHSYLAQRWYLLRQDTHRALLQKGRRTLAIHLVPRIVFSEDRQWWWDGGKWVGCAVVVPPDAQRSPDGRHWWDGYRWRPAPEIDVDSF